MGTRDVSIFALYGERKNAGDVNAPFYPTNGIEFFVSALGYDGGSASPTLVGYGIVPSSNTILGASTTLSAAISTVNATTCTITSATGFAVGQYIQIDVNAAGSTTSEVRKIQTLTGTTVTFDVALNFTHLNGATVTAIPTTASTVTVTGNTTFDAQTITSIGSTTGIVNGMGVSGPGVQANTIVTGVTGTTVTVSLPITQVNTAGSFIFTGPTPLFVHTILPGNTLSSLTIEKNLGGYQSLQFTGSRIGKFSLKLAASDAEAEFSASVIAQHANVLDSASISGPVSVTNESPFVFAEATLNFFGDTVAQVTSVSIDLENGLKPTYTFNNSHDLQFLTPVTRKVSGQMEVVFTSLDDSDWGYYSRMQTQAYAPLSIALTHPGIVAGGAESLVIYLPKVRLIKYGDGIKMEDVILSSLDFMSEYPLSGSLLVSIYAQVTNAQYLPY